MTSIKKAGFIFLVLINHFSYANADKNVSARIESQVVSGKARFTVLTPELIRMEWSENGIFEDKPTLTFIDRNLETPNFKVIDSKKNVIVKTDKLTLKYTKGAGFNERNLSITFFLNGEKRIWHPGMKDSLNLKGTMRTLDRQDGWQSEKLEQGILSRSGWALVDDTKNPVLTENERWKNWVTPRDYINKTDWYFFGYGHQYKKALLDYTKVSGKIPMPPRFAFGYWWSRYWQYSDIELKTLVETIKSMNVPIDVLIVDMDWHKTFGLNSRNKPKDAAGERKGWTGYSWDRNSFPEPEQFLGWAKSEHLKTALNLHPASGIMPYEDVYDDFSKAYQWDTTGQKYIPFDMDHEKWANVYFDKVIHPLENQGVDFWWLDWQQYKQSKRIDELSNTFWLNYTFFNDMKLQGKQRPILFHRWGGLGNHRYQVGFSGDTYTSWASLSFQPYFTSTASNVCYGYWSHDIGGHYFLDNGSKKNDPQLYLRWLQYGVFSPILRTHCTKDVRIERRIWMYPEYFEKMRSAIQLRYSLAPYIYNQARKAYDTGISICRPMYYDYPENKESYSMKEQYFFGDDILVAPIATPMDSVTGLSSRKLWLPQGKWFEISTGDLLDGGKVVERAFTLDEIPYYAKSGSIIPMNPSNVRNLQTKCDTLSLLFTPGDNTETTYFEDDGVTDKYDKEFTRTKIVKTTDASRKNVTIAVLPREGYYDNMSEKRSYEMKFPISYPPISVKINGEEVLYSSLMKPNSWTYDGFGLELCILTEAVPCDEALKVEIAYSPEQVEKLSLLNNKVKYFKRLIDVTERFKYQSVGYDMLSNLTTDFLGVSQIPSFISANPEKTIEYLEYFDTNFENAINQIRNFPNVDKSELNRLVCILEN